MAPEVRVTTKQVLWVGDDRLLLAIDVNVAITRAGLFKLSFVLPEGRRAKGMDGPRILLAK